jgi:DNA-binding XRE family transcriptional regulator
MGATVGTGNLEIQVRYWICPDCWNAGNLPFSILPAEDRYAPDQIPSLERVAKDLLYVAERYALPVTREIVLHIANALMALGREPAARERAAAANGGTPPHDPVRNTARRNGPKPRPAPEPRRPPGDRRVDGKPGRRPRGRGPFLGHRLAQRRRELGLSRRELAEEVSISYSYLGNLEKGDYRNPTPPFVAALARALAVSEEFFFG